MGLPKITHLQVVILSTLSSGSLPGKEVRAALTKAGRAMSLPAFYQATARMEDEGLIVGEYRQTPVEAKTLRERVYKLSPRGAAALRQAFTFYDQLRPKGATVQAGLQSKSWEGTARLN